MPAIDIQRYRQSKEETKDRPLKEGRQTFVPFRIDEDFAKSFKNRQPQYGFDGLGHFVYMRTYSRIIDEPDLCYGDADEEGQQERWDQTIRRVVNGVLNMQKRHILSLGKQWNEDKAQETAQKMFEIFYNCKGLPPGRSLWAMGTKLTEERKCFSALNNCAFVSTENIALEFSKPFCFLFDQGMLGVGVGFDTAGAGKMVVPGPDVRRPTFLYSIPDTREGWVESARLLLDAYLRQEARPQFDYSAIRPAGVPIKTFGGTSGGPKILISLHEELFRVWDKATGKVISTSTIVDTMNLLGKAIVSGNVRRAAEIAFGSPFDDEFLNLKNYERNPHRAAYGWTSNNTVFAEIGMDYSRVCEMIAKNGEPGLAWLENMQKFGRMCDKPDYKDMAARGGNPCMEQTLESYELCCLFETWPHHHDSLDDYLQTLKYGFLYAKTVTLGMTNWEETNAVLGRNRRVGMSMSGIAQFVAKHGFDELRRWSDAGYECLKQLDDGFSSWFEVPQSRKITSIKPSGTVSLLAGATPGVHFPESRFYLRRVRVSNQSPLLPELVRGGYRTEPDVCNPEHTIVVEFPVQIKETVRTIDDVTPEDQLEMAAFLQRFWADNQVSCTVTFDPERDGHRLPALLQKYQYQLKGISFLPRIKSGSYPQMVYEKIDEATYHKKSANLRPLDFWRKEERAEDPAHEQFCDGDYCRYS